MANDLNLELKIKALVQGLSDVKQMSKELEGVGKAAVEAERAQTAAFRLGAAARSAVTTLAVGAAAAGSAFVAMSKSVIDADAQLNALSGRTGIAAGTLAELEFAAKQSNTSIDEVARGVSNFNRVLFEAQRGGESKKFFDALGLDPKTIGEGEQALGKMADRIRALGSTAEQSAFTQKFFGRDSGTGFLEFLNLGSEGIDRLRRAAREAGVATNQSAKAADDFQDSMKLLSTQIQAVTRDALGPLLPKMSDFIRSAIDAKNVTGGWINALAQAARGTSISDLDKQIEETTSKIDKLTKKVEENKKPTAGNWINEMIWGSVSGPAKEIEFAKKHLGDLQELRDRAISREAADTRQATPPPVVSADLSVFEDKKRGGGGGAARDLSSQRFAIARAEAEGELKIQKDMLDRYGREWDFLLEKNLVSYREAAQARINIAQAEIDAELRARQDELDQAARIASDPGADEGKRLDALAKVKTLQADITVLRAQRGDVEVREGRKATEQEDELIAKMREVKAELDDLMGTGGGGAAVRAQLEQSMKSLLESPSLTDADKGVLEKFIGAKAAEADLRQFQEAYSRALDEMSVQQDKIQIERTAGVLTETQAREQLQVLFARTGEEIDALILKYQDLSTASNLPGFELALERARVKSVELRQSLDQMETQVKGSLGDAFGDFLTDIGTGAKSAGEALTDAIKGFERTVLSIINRRLGMMLVDSIFGQMSNINWGGGGFSPSGVQTNHFGGMIGGPTRSLRTGVSPLAFVGAPRFHRGGEVPAILQSGERVLSREEVAAGVGKPGSTVVNVINPPQQPTVTSSKGQSGEDIIDILFRPMEQWMGGRIARGDGLAGAISQRMVGGGVGR